MSRNGLGHLTVADRSASCSRVIPDTLRGLRHTFTVDVLLELGRSTLSRVSLLSQLLIFALNFAILLVNEFALLLETEVFRFDLSNHVMQLFLDVLVNFDLLVKPHFHLDESLLLILQLYLQLLNVLIFQLKICLSSPKSLLQHSDSVMMTFLKPINKLLMLGIQV